MVAKYTVTSNANHNGFTIIRIDDGNFAGIEYHYSRTTIEEKADSAILSFDYDVMTEKSLTKSEVSEFEKEIGDILFDILTTQLSEKEPSVVYGGGI